MLAHVGRIDLARQAMGQPDRQRHQSWRLVAGVAEHGDLVLGGYSADLRIVELLQFQREIVAGRAVDEAGHNGAGIGIEALQHGSHFAAHQFRERDPGGSMV